MSTDKVLFLLVVNRFIMTYASKMGCHYSGSPVIIRVHLGWNISHRSELRLIFIMPASIGICYISISLNNLLLWLLDPLLLWLLSLLGSLVMLLF